MPSDLERVAGLMAQAEPVDLPDDLRGEFMPDDRFPPAPTDPEEPPLPPEQICAGYPLNDYGNGLRFVTHFGEDLMWVPRVGWYVWTGQRWRRDDDGIEVRRMAQRLGGLIVEEIPWLTLQDWEMAKLGDEASLRAELGELSARTGQDGKPDPEAADQIEAVKRKLAAIDALKKELSELRAGHRRFARSSGNTGKIDSAMREGGVGIAFELDQLDASALDVNCESGVLRFSVDDQTKQGRGRFAEVTLMPHDRADRISKMMPVVYDKDARAPLFDAFLERIQPDPVMRRFLQRWLGLSMSAVMVQNLAFWYGSGANGKSVLADLVARIIGDYAATAKIESLTGRNKRGGGDATPDLVPLIGARYVRASEPDEGERLQEGLIKELTGGEPILVRALHSDFVEVRPQFKLTISGNHKPEIRGTDDGIWRRVMLVPFDVQIPEAERDQDLGKKLWEERSGILNWLVKGLLDFLEIGLDVPDVVADATREFREESDPIAAFLEACCVVSGSHEDSVTARDLGDAFNLYLEDRGEGQWKPRTVSLKLKEKSRRWKSPVTGQGFTARKSSTMSYDGIRFNDVFNKRFKEAPRDAQGRFLRTYAEAEADV